MRFRIVGIPVMGSHVITVRIWTTEQFSDAGKEIHFQLNGDEYDYESLRETLSYLIDEITLRAV